MPPSAETHAFTQDDLTAVFRFAGRNSVDCTVSRGQEVLEELTYPRLQGKSLSYIAHAYAREAFALAQQKAGTD